MAAFNVEKITHVHHWNDTLFSFKTTRDTALRFKNGQFVMIGLEVNGKPLMRAYSIASANYEEELEFFSIKVPDGPLTSILQKVKVGDEILVKSAQILMRVIESMEDAYVFRIGGEEFVIALPDMQLKDACHIAQQCCHQVSAMSANYADKVLKLSISCGVAHQYQDGVLAETLAKADQALYQAKYSSKNCTCYSDGDGINLFEC